MPKYSAGTSTQSGNGTTCEMCGASSDSLTEATIAGANLEVCDTCLPDDQAPDEDTAHTNTGTSNDRQRETIERTTSDGSETLFNRDSSHWEADGPHYEDDPLPYLVAGYGDRVTEARQADGLEVKDLAQELGVDEFTILAVEQDRAMDENVNGSVITALETELDITLTEDE